MSLNFSSSQLARISLAEFVSKLIFIQLDFACELGPGLRDDLCSNGLHYDEEDSEEAEMLSLTHPLGFFLLFSEGTNKLDHILLYWYGPKCFSGHGTKLRYNIFVLVSKKRYTVVTSPILGYKYKPGIVKAYKLCHK